MAYRVIWDEGRAYNEHRIIGALTTAQLNFLEAKGVLPESGSISIRDHDIGHMLRPTKPNKWTPEELATLPDLLAAPKAILWSNRNSGFLYAGGEQKKGPPWIAVVKLDKRQKINRQWYTVNNLRTTSDISWAELLNAGNYTIISGGLE
jgi:hypothetical protein